MTLSRETLFGTWCVGVKTLLEGWFGLEFWSKNARLESAGMTGTRSNMRQAKHDRGTKPHTPRNRRRHEPSA